MKYHLEETKKNHKELGWERPNLVPLEKYPNCCEVPEIKNNPGNQHFLADIILMAIFNRMTGNILSLQKFPQWNNRRNGRTSPSTQKFLPTREILNDYGAFLVANRNIGTGTHPKGNNYISKQHNSIISKSLRSVKNGASNLS